MVEKRVYTVTGGHPRGEERGSARTTLSAGGLPGLLEACSKAGARPGCLSCCAHLQLLSLYEVWTCHLAATLTAGCGLPPQASTFKRRRSTS